MRSYRGIVLGVLLFGTFLLQAREVQVRLFSDQKVQRFMVSPDSADFLLIALDSKGEILDTIYDLFPKDPNRTFVVSHKPHGLELKLGDEKIGDFRGLLFLGYDSIHQFRITANKKNRAYFGSLKVLPQKSELYIINKVDLEHYVAGVVESEAGHVSELEFYKAQAVLARTFAVRNMNKHLAEGYNLKDDVSSQVYFSKAHYTNKDLILAAVAATRDTVLVNLDCEPVLSVFHANSGGMTVNSEDVWLQAVPELKAREDSFSIGVGSYSWEKRIKADQFFSYFARMFNVKNDEQLQKALLNFDQEQRQTHFRYNGKGLKLTKVRQDFRLRSTYFSVDLEGDEVVLKGKGYGHGVGMAQDGAIEMSKKGYVYKAILRYYFSQVDFDSLQWAK